MRVRILYFGVLKDLFGREREEMELVSGTTVADLIRRVQAVDGRAGMPWRSIAIAVNRTYVQASVVLEDGDEVALLPPVSGGRDAY